MCFNNNKILLKLTIKCLTTFDNTVRRPKKYSGRYIINFYNKELIGKIFYKVFKEEHLYIITTQWLRQV